MIEHTVDADQDGQRVDKFLARLFAKVPRSHIYRLLRLRRVRVNGVRASQSTLLKAGDRIVIRADPERLLADAPEAKTPKSTSLSILFEDADVLAVDKPAGLAVHPGSGIEGATLVDLARVHCGQGPAGSFSASPAHRLDRDTSGVVLVAKSRKAMVRLTEIFTAGDADKRYLALVKGRLSEPTGTIDLPLAEHEQTANSRSRRGVNYQAATTHWQVLSEGVKASLISCRIETGRTHQIRRHLAAIGHPVAGDRRHGDFAFNRELRVAAGLRRMFLHAERLEIEHPITARRLTLTATLPVELSSVLPRLGLTPPA